MRHSSQTNRGSDHQNRADFSLLDALVDLCFVLSRDGVVKVANKAAMTALGRTVASLEGEQFVLLLDEPSVPLFQEAFSVCFDRGARQVCVVGLRLPGGVTHPVELSLTTFAGEDGDMVCIVDARDVARERERDIDLLRFSNVAHYTLNPLEITDVNGRIIYVNPAFERASGYAREELIGKNPRVFGSGKHPKAFWDAMWSSITAGRVWVGEVENRRRNGEPFHTYLLISPVVDHEQQIIGYFGIHRDITEQKHLEHQLHRAQKMESIGTLAAGIAHEVGNPLTSISSLVQVIQRSTEDEFTREKLDLIRHQVTRISKIIRDLVDFSRPSTYTVQQTDINRAIRKAVEIIRVGKKAKSVRFDLNLDPNLPPIRLVPDQVEQVFINILLNAVDAVNDAQLHGTSPLEGMVSVSSFVREDHVHISIEDNGKGMQANEVEQIFEPFFTTKGVGEGTGLGLWVSYGIVRSFHGQIRVESTPGEGSTFTIFFPIQPGS
jgi:PAS domain S-box-containing protein